MSSRLILPNHRPGDDFLDDLGSGFNGTTQILISMDAHDRDVSLCTKFSQAICEIHPRDDLDTALDGNGIRLSNKAFKPSEREL